MASIHKIRHIIKLKDLIVLARMLLQMLLTVGGCQWTKTTMLPTRFVQEVIVGPPLELMLLSRGLGKRAVMTGEKPRLALMNRTIGTTVVIGTTHTTTTTTATATVTTGPARSKICLVTLRILIGILWGIILQKLLAVTTGIRMRLAAHSKVRGRVATIMDPPKMSETLGGMIMLAFQSKRMVRIRM